MQGMQSVSLKRLFASAMLIGIGAALIAILCRPSYDLRPTAVPFLIVGTAGGCISAGFAAFMRWPIRAWAIAGAIVAAIILLGILLETAEYSL